MNRSFTNVLFGGFGQVQTAGAGGEQRHYKAETIEDAAVVLEQSSLVVVIPGYGMAVSQAQHRVRELYDELIKRGIQVKFAIHPVAGRMPGHMNVLLAEADIPYSDLVEMDDINPEMPQCDVALVIGADDVVNPAARTDRRARFTGCRSSTPTGPVRCSQSSAARTPVSRGSITSCTSAIRPTCSSATPRRSSAIW